MDCNKNQPRKGKSIAEATSADTDHLEPAPSTTEQHSSPPPTFYACCDTCGQYFEYHRIYLNQNLLCIQCQHAFLAKEVQMTKPGSWMPTAEYRNQKDLKSSESGPSRNNLKGISKKEEASRAKGKRAGELMEGASAQTAASNGRKKKSKTEIMGHLKQWETERNENSTEEGKGGSTAEENKPVRWYSRRSKQQKNEGSKNSDSWLINDPMIWKRNWVDDLNIETNVEEVMREYDVMKVLEHCTGDEVIKKYDPEALKNMWPQWGCFPR